jgi:hypothetical protein
MMARFRSRPQDDENDTQLFAMLQEYVLIHYPNPERTGCLDPETLRAFVYSPDALDLSNERFLHIFKCAECTKDLIRHRDQLARQEKHAREIVNREGSFAAPLRVARSALMVLLTIGCAIAIA